MQNFGAGDLIEIALEGTSKSDFVRFANAFVPEVDIKAGRIVVVLPEAGDDDGPDAAP